MRYLKQAVQLKVHFTVYSLRLVENYNKSVNIRITRNTNPESINFCLFVLEYCAIWNQKTFLGNPQIEFIFLSGLLFILLFSK